MEAEYHVQMTETALGDAVTAAALAEITAANLGQDAHWRNIPLRPAYHFDNSDFAAGEAYVAEQRARAVAALVREGDIQAARAAFGRLLHARQDFYAHSNWIARWVEAQGGLDACQPAEAPLCPDSRLVPGLVSGTATIRRYLLYQLPVLGPWFRRHYVPAGSHEAMNLDHPGRGPLFSYALAAATRHTWHEWQALRAAVTATGEPSHLIRFGWRDGTI